MPNYRHFFKKLWVFPLLIVLVLMIWPLYSRSIADCLGILTGAMVSLLPNAVFAYYYFHNEKPLTARNILTKLYLGELLKIVVSIGLFIFFLSYFHVRILPLLVSYASCQMVFWFLLLDGVRTRVR